MVSLLSPCTSSNSSRVCCRSHCNALACSRNTCCSASLRCCFSHFGSSSITTTTSLHSPQPMLFRARTMNSYVPTGNGPRPATLLSHPLYTSAQYSAPLSIACARNSYSIRSAEAYAHLQIHSISIQHCSSRSEKRCAVTTGALHLFGVPNVNALIFSPDFSHVSSSRLSWSFFFALSTCSLGGCADSSSFLSSFLPFFCASMS
mmetsp:Transcript_23735/g.46141  ORF Transcript_23735/g.46141 Transcript_23735/m.46141 type:complete len:204 (-) Transcript_23735:2001-2612(-)